MTDLVDLMALASVALVFIVPLVYMVWRSSRPGKDNRPAVWTSFDLALKDDVNEKD